MKVRILSAAFGLLLAALAMPVKADQIHVAVAANFNEPAREIAELFRKKTHHKVILITGSSGAFYTQITHGAPFEVFLSAEQIQNKPPQLQKSRKYSPQPCFHGRNDDCGLCGRGSFEGAKG